MRRPHRVFLFALAAVAAGLVLAHFFAIRIQIDFAPVTAAPPSARFEFGWLAPLITYGTVVLVVGGGVGVICWWIFKWLAGRRGGGPWR